MGGHGPLPSFFSFGRAGYAIVIQDVRGAFRSEGVFTPKVNEPKDGRETIEWIARQPWSDGAVAICGPSYLGMVQWAAAKVGVVLVNINPAYCTAEVEYALNKVGCKALILAARHKSRPRPDQKRLPGARDQQHGRGRRSSRAQAGAGDPVLQQTCPLPRGHGGLRNHRVAGG